MGVNNHAALAATPELGRPASLSSTEKDPHLHGVEEKADVESTGVEDVDGNVINKDEDVALEVRLLALLPACAIPNTRFGAWYVGHLGRRRPYFAGVHAKDSALGRRSLCVHFGPCHDIYVQASSKYSLCRAALRSALSSDAAERHCFTIILFDHCLYLRYSNA